MRLKKSLLLSLGIGALTVSLCAAALTPLVRRARLLHPKSGQTLVVPGKDGEATLLFNGWRITPAGRHIPTGDLLLGGAFSPDGKTLAIANCGWSAHKLHLVDAQTEQKIATLSIDHAANGIVWTPDGKRVIVSGNATNTNRHLYVYAQDESGTWALDRRYTLTGNDPKKTAICGLAITPNGQTLFACNTSDGHLYVLDVVQGDTKARVPVGDHPVTCRLNAKGDRLYVANWGGDEVVALDVTDPIHPQVVARLQTGDHPNDLALSADSRLFVSCGNENVVNVFDTGALQPMETIKTSLTPKAPPGSTPNALALAPDGKRLYVANADNNCIAVVDVARRGKSRVVGFIPTGWYPTAVLVSPDGKKVIACSGKGTGSRPNPSAPVGNREYVVISEYIGRQLNGLISFLDAPNAEQLAAYTRQVYANVPYNDAQLARAASQRKTAIPTRVGQTGPIKYVLYIIKENRTYDQVFGDIEKGNGDPNLTLFGRDVTPNHHALAEQFVLLDNLYCSGEVSQDGHPWSTSAYCPDFTQRNWVLSYSGKTQGERAESVTDPKAGYIWEAVKRKGLTFRTYGEYAEHPSVAGHSCLEFIGKGAPGSPPPGRDMDKADIFIREFREFERQGKIPRFMIMSLGENHTNGTRVGSFTPKAMVGSNDLALGKIVEAITKSSVWKEFAIFVIEDDAQNGPDHVDSHRTVGLVISPYVRRGSLDSTMYSTASMLRTMELILGLPPLTQYDASATPMFACFTDKPDLTPYACLPPRTDLMAKNRPTDYGARASAKMDFREYDRIDEQELNRILWHSIKGARVPMPAPVRRALARPDGRLHDNTVRSEEEEEGD